MKPRYTLTSAIGLLAILSLPVSRRLLELNLVTHIVVQMPVLVFCGWVIARRLAPFLEPIGEEWNAGGATGLAAVSYVFAFWMLPRSVDGAVQTAIFEIGKFLTLPIAGAVLALSWPRLPSLAIGVLKANVVSMLPVLAWIYSASPVRLCSSYLRSDQDILAYVVAFIAVVLSATWGASIMAGRSSEPLGDSSLGLGAKEPEFSR
ncbi:hypothetical protein ACVIGB_003852 [Bradyrhizobium sp. USDA 4341]